MKLTIDITEAELTEYQVGLIKAGDSIKAAIYVDHRDAERAEAARDTLANIRDLLTRAYARATVEAENRRQTRHGDA